MNTIMQEILYTPQTGFGVQAFGEPPTFVGWQKQYKSIIDFILYKEIRCIQYAVLADCFPSGRLLSDHR